MRQTLMSASRRRRHEPFGSAADSDERAREDLDECTRRSVRAAFPFASCKGRKVDESHLDGTGAMAKPSSRGYRVSPAVELGLLVTGAAAA